MKTVYIFKVLILALIILLLLFPCATINADFSYGSTNYSKGFMDYYGYSTDWVFPNLGDKQYYSIVNISNRADVQNVSFDNDIYGIGLDICGNVFSKCPNLQNVMLPLTCRTIENNAFSDCPNLTSVTIPGNLLYIADTAFSNCPNLTIYGRGNSYVEGFAKKHGIKFVVDFPDFDYHIHTTNTLSKTLSGRIIGDVTLELDDRDRTLGSCIFILAAYEDNGVLSFIKTEKAQLFRGDYTPPNNKLNCTFKNIQIPASAANNIKAFVWSSQSSMQPLQEAQDIIVMR